MSLHTVFSDDPADSDSGYDSTTTDEMAEHSSDEEYEDDSEDDGTTDSDGTIEQTDGEVEGTRHKEISKRLKLLREWAEQVEQHRTWSLE
jgi:hypothetical protein